ncbi:alkaline phosphatase family protein [Chryseolinea sp. T2]|uniref:alkaline phosphatase family protein n=1 Tax=Chryseolinea sp. T2 TaxID=3129255 RepID=UPI003076F7E1
MHRILILAICLFATPSFAQKTKTQNVILVTLDGMRWQEVFGGADSTYMKQQQHLKDGKLKEKYWRDDLQARREALFPFLWTTVAKQGQLYGNRNAGSLANVTNNQWFSYPGYNEILTGRADDARVNSNDKFYNPNQNVLEFIHSKPGFSGKVAAFTSWDVFPYIINDKRNNILVSAGLVTATKSPNDTEKLLNKLMGSVPNPLGDVRLDAFTFNYGMEYMKRNKPRVMYFAFDETDDFAHGGEYGAYLNSAHATDASLAELWNFVQSDPAYKGTTTLIVTVDHGRGPTTEDWKHHGIKVAGADQIWLAIIGPDSQAVGEVKSGQIYQKQVAQTIASLLGLNFKSDPGQGDAIAIKN